MSITVFTDGAARGNPGPGGWGAIVAIDERVTELGGREEHTTNNRMELCAVIRALEYIKQPSVRRLADQPSVTICTDSGYVLNGATKWVLGWKKNNWKTATKKDVLNRDLWERLAELLPQLTIKWKLLKGHAGIAGNERCDEIATAFADLKKIHLYDGPLQGYTVSFDITPSNVSRPKSKASKTGKAYSYVSEIGGIVEIHKTWAQCEARVKGKNARFKKALTPEEEASLVRLWKQAR